MVFNIKCLGNEVMYLGISLLHYRLLSLYFFSFNLFLNFAGNKEWKQSLPVYLKFYPLIVNICDFWKKENHTVSFNVLRNLWHKDWTSQKPELRRWFTESTSCLGNDQAIHCIPWNFFARLWPPEHLVLEAGHDLACQQEVSLALTETPPIHYYNVVDSEFSNYAG